MTEEGKTGSEAVQADGALTNSELIERLRMRSADCGQKSMTARLTAVIDLVEALLARGYDRSQVREILVEVGWRFTADSFDSALSRVRKRQMPVAGKTGDAHGQAHGGAEPTEAAGPPTSPDNGPLVGSGELGGKDAGLTSFADVFLERKDFTAGRHWK